MMPELDQPESMRNEIYNIILSLKPCDNLETTHIQETLLWIKSGGPIFRIAKPDVPLKHLVSYFVLFDEKTSKILL